MNIPPAKDVKAGTRFFIKTPNGMVEFRVLKLAHGRGADKFLTTIDGTTLKQVVRLAECSIKFGGTEFAGNFTLVQPMDDGTWVVRAEFIIGNDQFWEGAQ